MINISKHARAYAKVEQAKREALKAFAEDIHEYKRMRELEWQDMPVQSYSQIISNTRRTGDKVTFRKLEEIAKAINELGGA